MLTRVGRVLEIAPNPSRISKRESKFITVIIRKIKYPGNHCYQKPKSSIPIGAKVEISLKGFTLGVKDNLGKKKTFQSAPKLLINAEHYGLVLAPRLKKEYHQIWEANLQPLGPMF
jgi:hypothetical protein